MTATLHIEHPVRDFESWKRTFDQFHEFRLRGGVRSYRLARNAEVDSDVTIDLVFDNPDAASAFRRMLLERVWTAQRASEVLTGTPSATILNLVEDRTISP